MRLIITGADGALGQAVVGHHAALGHRVAAIQGDPDAMHNPTEGLFVASDLTDEAVARQVIGEAAHWLGAVDGLIHLAGGFRWIETTSASLADWRAMFDANIGTAVACIGAVVPLLTSGSSIVLVGANSAQPAAAGMGPYAAAKSGVSRLTEALSAELKSSRIRVNAILPGIIDTPRNRADMPDADRSSWTQPEAIADVVAFLMSTSSRAINGASAPVTNAA